MYSLDRVVALLCCFAVVGGSSVHDPPVVAFAGNDVVLPCRHNIGGSDDIPTVEWSKKGLKPTVVFLYRDGCETHEMKNPAFEFRTSLIMREVKNRDFSLRIANVQRSDSGTYQCMTLWQDSSRDVRTVELVVDAVSEPQLSVVSAERGAVTLQCEARCCQLEPRITFLDEEGSDIDAEDPKRGRDNSSGCCTVTRKVILQKTANSVTCRVHYAEVNQTRDTRLLIPADCTNSCTAITVTAAVLSSAGLVVILGLSAFLWKKCRKSAGGQKRPVTRQKSDQSSTSGSFENALLLTQTDKTHGENVNNEVAELESQLQEAQQTNQTLREELSLLRSKRCTVVCQVNQPTIPPTPPTISAGDTDLCSLPSNPDNPSKAKRTSSFKRNPANSVKFPKKKAVVRQHSCPELGRPLHLVPQNHSSPAPINCTPAAKNPGIIHRSRSVLNHNPRHIILNHRRHSVSGLALSNPYRHLPNVKEEPEPLNGDIFHIV